MRITLPWPPSANRIWREARGRVYISKEYQSFLEAAKSAWLMQGGRRLDENDEIEVDLLLFPPNRRPYDVDNRIKPTLDALTKIGFWKDDRIVSRVSAKRCQPVEFGAVVATLTPGAKEKVDPEEFGLAVLEKTKRRYGAERAAAREARDAKRAKRTESKKLF